MAETRSDLWSYRDPHWRGIDLSGYEVAARDGTAGRVGEADTGYLVVQTGPWIFRRAAIIPAGLVEHVNTEQQAIYVGVTKDEIRSAPEPDPVSDDTHLRRLLADHYGQVLSSS